MILSILLMIIFALDKSSGNCIEEPTGVFRFGPECGFMCHCRTNEQCDVNTGQCPSGCAKYWYGPGCQYRDIAEGEFSRHSDNVHPPRYSNLANDGDPTTCSSTADVKRPNKNTKPFWRVWFPTSETIRELMIVTQVGKLDFFKNFRVYVENVPSSLRENNGHIPSNRSRCNKHGNEPNRNETIKVVCAKPVVGNQVRIQLAALQRQLVLCDVRINGGRNLAFRRRTSQISTSCNEGNNCKSINAVDGIDAQSPWLKCGYTKSEHNPWWSLDLGQEMMIWYIRIFPYKDGERFKLHVEVQNSSYSNVETIDTGTYVRQPVNMSLNTVASTVKIVRQSTSSLRALKLCEVKVFGDCLEDLCGYGCKSVCHCKYATIWDKISGECSSGCKDGWAGSNCDSQCNKVSDGGKCIPVKTCSNNCRGGQENCNPRDGTCKRGCIAGWKKPLCNEECTKGYYGDGCTGICSNYCKDGNETCNRKDGTCTGGCIGGWEGELCDKQCAQGYYGDGCSHSCSGHCKGGSETCGHVNGRCSHGCNAGWERPQCNKECDKGFYGNACSKQCSVYCLGGKESCSHINGICNRGCIKGWTGSLCNTECAQGYYGDGCSHSCSDHCKGGSKRCDHVNGRCSHGCNAGWKRSLCNEECDNGSYGERCMHSCSDHCKGGSETCNHVNGSCSNGCYAGWKGPLCNEECDNGFYGNYCSQQCSLHCLGGKESCSHVDGTCTKGCIKGWTGSLCTTECDKGFYGNYCSQQCSLHCLGGKESCSHINGTCKRGCIKGWTGSLCNIACPAGFHSDNCSTECGRCEQGTICDNISGACRDKCSPGFSNSTGFGGDKCLPALKPTEGSMAPSTTGVVAGVTVTVSVAIALVVIAISCYIKQKRKQRTGGRELQSAESYINHENARAPTTSHDAETSMSATRRADEPNVYANARCVDQRKRSMNAVNIADLLTYVKGNMGQIVDQFQSIPFGMKHPYTVAKKVCNRGKNKYRDMYAYDHTRVVLQAMFREQGSDYINASYIKGYLKEQAYIAAQAPIPTSIDDFWRMIWEKDVYTVAMLTNLVEETKTKCLQYWPTIGSRILYGDYLVSMETETVFAEFTVRSLRVSKEDSELPSRNVRQFHYTAWPDKDVPRSASSLLQFWRKVRKNDASKSYTWLVHCSAGVGRTGTFIAMDILFDEAMATGSVDVYKCVSDLRQQRVNMVQTKNQYKFLYGLMVENFILPAEPVSLDNYHQVMNFLNGVDHTTQKTKLLIQYKTLNEDLVFVAASEDSNDRYSAAMLPENQNKNRFMDILPANEIRPFLITNIPNCTNYINAVFIPSYCEIHGYVLTQTPLKNTAIDCCGLVYELDAKLVVTFDDDTCSRKRVGTYLPENGSVTLGPFKIVKISEDDRTFYSKMTFSMTYGSERRPITQLVFKGWPISNVIPGDPRLMLDFIQEVEYNKRMAENNPVIFQCLNGSERSGLLVVLMNILERARLENEVSVPQVIRQIRSRREQIIPNFEQFKFCYDVLLYHVDNNVMYANL